MSDSETREGTDAALEAAADALLASAGFARDGLEPRNMGERPTLTIGSNSLANVIPATPYGRWERMMAELPLGVSPHAHHRFTWAYRESETRLGPGHYRARKALIRTLGRPKMARLLQIAAGKFGRDGHCLGVGPAHCHVAPDGHLACLERTVLVWMGAAIAPSLNTRPVAPSVANRSAQARANRRAGDALRKREMRARLAAIEPAFVVPVGFAPVHSVTGPYARD